MTAVAYAMSDTAPSADGRRAPAHIYRPVTAGGCGQQHEIQVDDFGRPYLECDRCAPALTAGHYGFSADPHGVPLTPDEHRENDYRKRQAEQNQATLMTSMTQAFMQALSSGAVFPGAAGATQPAPAKSLLEQIQELSVEEKAALADVLAPKPAEEPKGVPEIGAAARDEKAGATPTPRAAPRGAASRIPRPAR
jgi:hypothetical protein